MADRMAKAHASVAQATITGEANISSWGSGDSLMLRLIRSIGVACEAEPLLNTAFDERTFALVAQSEVNLGIAIETPDGLFVPVLRDIINRSRGVLAEELKTLREAVTERHIRSTQLRGQTITLSNFGAVGGIYAQMIVVPPQVAIVGAGRAFERLVLVADKPVSRRFLPLSVSFDHRVVTGVEACRFLNAIKADLEQNG
jgi:pyruvate dehydrogenase E2 component (dihydrolipoamide acetyltransferase)